LCAYGKRRNRRGRLRRRALREMIEEQAPGALQILAFLRGLRSAQ
jgi:hypothetical protein